MVQRVSNMVLFKFLATLAEICFDMNMKDAGRQLPTGVVR
jgi:hypothetical protein